MRLQRVVLLIAAWSSPRGVAAQDSTQVDTIRVDTVYVDSMLGERTGFGTRTTLRGSLFRTFFNDSPEQLFGLVPGVVLRGAETGLASAASLSIRGGRAGGASVYIDGAPVRFNVTGRAGIALSAGSLAEASVTTGPPDLSLGDVRDGVIEYVTRSGGERLSGFVQAATDEIAPGVGYNRFEGGVGGPLPVPNATWYVGASITGQRQHYVGMGSEDVPSYVPGGVDTVVTRDVGGSIESVSIPSFVDRRAYDWATELRGHARVDLALGSKSHLSLTGVANETQERFFPGLFALAPSLYSGARSTARLLVVNGNHELGSKLSLRVHASVGSNQEIGGLLEPGSEAASKDPALGITLETLRFTGVDSIPFPVSDRLLFSIRTNSGLRVPYLNRDDLRNDQDSRANPYGMENSWYEQGVDGSITMSWEQRRELRLAVDWAVASGHTVTIGGNLTRTDLSHYSSSLLRQSLMDVYRVQPGQTGFYVNDRFALSRVRGEFGLRYDHVGGAGLFPRVPGRIYTNPAFNRPGALVDDTAYQNSLARVAVPGGAHKALSGRVALMHTITSRTVLRAAAGRWLAPPDWGAVLAGTNNDLDFTNTSQFFGRDIEWGYSGRAEIGAAHRVRSSLLADVALYWTTRPRYVARFESFADPANPGDIVNVNVLAKDDVVMDIGADFAIDWTVASTLRSRATLSLRSTDYGRQGAGPLGPVEVASVSASSISGALQWRPTLGPLNGTEIAAVMRLTSGTWYSPSLYSGSNGSGVVTPGFDNVLVGNPAQLPWVKRVDLRVRRSVALGPSEWSVFAEARNLFGWENILALFGETEAVVNPSFQDQLLDVEFFNLEREAADNSRLLANGDIDLQPNCQSWTITSGSGGAVVNCVALRRAEARFGNGDGLYSLAERTTALNAFFNAFYGPQTFYGQGRTVRLGVEIRW